MLKQLVLDKKLQSLRNELDVLLKQEDDLVARREKLAAAIEEAKTDEELQVVEESVAELEAEQGELVNKKSKLEEEIQLLEAELQAIESKEPDNTQRSKGVDKVEKRDLRQAIADYVRHKVVRQEVEGFKVVDGGVLIPEELLLPEEKKRDTVDLANYVRTIPVNRGSGKIPIIKKSGGKFISVAELEKNPELAKPQIDEVSYDIETYRGYIPVSQEAIDDADYDIAGLIASDIADQELNTRNEAIAEILKTAPAESVQGIDGLKTLLNTKIKQVYNTKLFVTASLYNELDLAKDKNGRYLLQDSITAASGKTFAGREVVVLDDDILGDGVTNLNAFVGDAYEYCAFFNRKRASVKWTDHNIFGQLLAGFVRFDVGVVDEDAGYYITFTPDTPDSGN